MIRSFSGPRINCALREFKKKKYGRSGRRGGKNRTDPLHRGRGRQICTLLEMQRVELRKPTGAERRDGERSPSAPTPVRYCSNLQIN
jgi:hypothetical protein